MRRFLLIALVFILTAYVGQFVMYTSIKHLLDGNSQYRLTRYFRQPKHHFIAIGNSRTVNVVNEHYAKNALQKDLINIAISGMPYVNLLDLMRHVNSENHGSTIFLEITCLSNNDVDKGFSYYSENNEFIHRRYRHDVSNYLQLLSLNNDFLIRNIYHLHESDDDWLYPTHINASLKAQVALDRPSKVIPDFELFKNRLDTISSICQSNRNELIIFLAPYYPPSLTKLTDYREILKFLDVHKPGYRFVNLNNMPLTDFMFADRIHTNIFGSYMLTDTLIRFSRQQIFVK